MNNTPETDAAMYIDYIDDKEIECTPADFARKLERERDEWKEKACVLQSQIDNADVTLDMVKTAVRQKTLSESRATIAKLQADIVALRDQLQDVAALDTGEMPCIASDCRHLLESVHPGQPILDLIEQMAVALEYVRARVFYGIDKVESALNAAAPYRKEKP